MAMEGYQTYVTTYAPFVTYRCADQVRHLMGNMNLNIKAIGSSAGLTSDGQELRCWQLVILHS